MDKQYIETLQGKYKPGRISHGFLIVLALFLVSMVAWSSVGRLDIVSQAQGEVIPSTRTRTVQHLEGGIVREILVREGQVVEQGQPMVVLEQIISDAFFEEVQARIVSLRLDEARLEAQKNDLDSPVYPEDLKEKHTQLVNRSTSLFHALQNAHESSLASQRELIRQREHTIREITTRRENSLNSLALLEEQIELSQALLEENMTTRYQHLAYLREESSLKSRIEEDAEALEAARAALSEARAELHKIRTEHRKYIESQLKKTRQDLEEVRHKQRRHADSLARTVLRAPGDGVVKSLTVTTIGGVIGPGMEVAEIVPADDTLVVEAKLPVSDIGYVHEGQVASVRLSARESVMFGKLEGRVIHVAPDTTVTDEGGAFYAVRVQTKEDSFRHKEMEYRLYPGMHMQVSIHTGTRTVLQYLLDPLLGTMSGILQER